MTTETFELSHSQQAILEMEALLSGCGFHVGGIAQLPTDFPFGQLTQVELNVIIYGALA